MKVIVIAGWIVALVALAYLLFLAFLWINAKLSERNDRLLRKQNDAWDRLRRLNDAQKQDRPVLTPAQRDAILVRLKQEKKV